MAAEGKVSSRFLAVFLLLLLLFLQIAQGSSKTAEEESRGDGSSRRRTGGVNSDLKLNRKEILKENEEGMEIWGAVEEDADEESSVALEKESEKESLVSVVDVPLSCPARCFRLNPVCGVDGQTYWCGAVDAGCAGVAVDYTGFCEFVSKGSLGGKALESLLLVHMVWLILTALFLLVGAP